MPKDKGTDHSQVKIKLDLQSYISSEYNFALKTAEHLMIEQQKIVDIYIILSAILYAAAFFVFKILKSDAISIVSGKGIIFTLFILLFLIGIINVLKLVRLRKVWWNCNHIMNKIKDVYTKQLESDNNIITWTQDAIKHTFQEKYDGVYSLSAIVVIVLDSLAMGIAVIFADFSYLIGMVTVLVLASTQIIYFKLK